MPACVQACFARLAWRCAKHSSAQAGAGIDSRAHRKRTLPAANTLLFSSAGCLFSWHPAVLCCRRCCSRARSRGPVLPLSPQDVKRVLRSPGCVLDGLALQYAVLPSLALLLVQLLGLPPEYAVGECRCARAGRLLAWPIHATVRCMHLRLQADPSPARPPLQACCWSAAAPAAARLQWSATLRGRMCR